MKKCGENTLKMQNGIEMHKKSAFLQEIQKKFRFNSYLPYSYN